MRKPVSARTARFPIAIRQAVVATVEYTGSVFLGAPLYHWYFPWYHHGPANISPVGRDNEALCNS
jgi:hypothetical protein